MLITNHVDQSINVINQDHEVWTYVVIFATWTYWAKMLRHNHFTKCINQVLLIFIQNMLCNVLVEMFLLVYPCSLDMLIIIHEIGLSFLMQRSQCENEYGFITCVHHMQCSNLPHPLLFRLECKWFHISYTMWSCGTTHK